MWVHAVGNEVELSLVERVVDWHVGVSQELLVRYACTRFAHNTGPGSLDGIGPAG